MVLMESQLIFDPKLIFLNIRAYDPKRWAVSLQNREHTHKTHSNRTSADAHPQTHIRRRTSADAHPQTHIRAPGVPKKAQNPKFTAADKQLKKKVGRPVIQRKQFLTS